MSQYVHDRTDEHVYDDVHQDLPQDSRISSQVVQLIHYLLCNMYINQKSENFVRRGSLRF